MVPSPLMVSLLALAVSACTTGVNDSGFTGTFTGPPANSDPTAVTTFGSGTADDDGNDTNEDSNSQGSEDGSSGGGMVETSADDGTTTMPEPTTTDPGDSSTTMDPGGCNPPCAAMETCVDGVCVPDRPECNDVPGNYETCLGPGGVTDTSACGDPGSGCLTGGMPPIVGVCSITPCTDTCDCPEAPPTGNAVLSCDAITGGPDNFCYLDCSGGETCPTGMTCYADLACVWPGDGADGTPYGDCFNNDISVCGIDGTCLNDDAMMPTVGVCAEPCNVVGDCSAAPGGTAPVTCQDVTGEGDNECVLDCSGGGTCPAGMTCFGALLCMWT